MFGSGNAPKSPPGACPGWLMTAVASWGENAEDAYDQGLVEMGLGDSRLIEVQVLSYLWGSKLLSSYAASYGFIGGVSPCNIICIQRR